MLRHPRQTLLAILTTTLLLGSPALAQGGERVPAAVFGEPFPTATFKNLNPEHGGEMFDVASVAGKKPVIFCYWIAGQERSETILQELAKVVEDAGSDKVALLAVATERPGRDAAAISQRVKELGLKVPVLNDVGFVLGQRLVVQTVPNIAMLDKDGTLRLGNGAALIQTVEYKMDVEKVVRRAAETGSVGMYGQLPKYYPAQELIGSKCPDFKAAAIDDGIVRRYYSLFDPDEVNVLVFWSVDCPHCKKTMPQINDWLRQNPNGINLVSVSRGQNDAERNKTKEFCQFHKFDFPTLVDKDRKLAEMFKVTATPTILIIRPDGVIDSVVTQGSFSQAFEKSLRELLKTSS
jgi:thiol-disulfide isomerase/thioredoxin